MLAGLPVYNPNENVETSRTFYGFSVDALNLLDLFDVNVFINIQDVDDVNDREAAGAEIRYFGGNRSLIASVDYDFGYSELNSVAALGNWTFDNSLTVNGRFDWRNSPYLTTENALIGQPASSIQDLLLTYTEGEIRQLALDRSGAMQSFALGVSRPISERFQISADVTASQYDGTPDSGGVRRDAGFRDADLFLPQPGRHEPDHGKGICPSSACATPTAGRPSPPRCSSIPASR